MKKVIAIFASVIFFYGCGNVDRKDDNTTEEIIIPSDIDDYTNTQWYTNYDEEFFTLNSIDSDAHIHNSIYNQYTGKNIKIAIIDDGFDTSHSELENRIYKQINTTNIGNGDDVSHSNDYEYHGTAETSIIAANDNGYGITGIASNAQLILIKMAEYSSDEETINMFKAAVEVGADIINCSWGTGEVGDTVRDYINEISQTKRNGKGVIIVFASGNGDTDMIGDESAIDGVIGVGATDHTNLRTSYSDYGEDLDVVAPGGEGDYYTNTPDISTLDPIGTNGHTDNSYNLYNEYGYNKEYDTYEYLSFAGTSASAPIVSGVLALVLEANPNLTRIEIQNLLKTTSDKIGQNVPYIEDKVVSNSATPYFQGQLGSENFSDFKLKITSSDNITYGPYSINIDGNNWNSQVTDNLVEGFYKAELYSTEFARRQETNTTIATDKSFEINLSKESKINSIRNDFYGYGKINVDKLIESALLF